MFYGVESWDKHLFDGYSTSVNIPVDDCSAFVIHNNKWYIYEKLWLYKAQNIQVYPLMANNPLGYPVFCKPVMNLYGMSMGCKILKTKNDFDYKPGYLVMPVLTGDQYTIDCVVINGEIKWYYPFKSIRDSDITFSSFQYSPLPYFVLDKIMWFSSCYLNDHVGVVNFEVIGSDIIECHLRMSTCLMSLYGDGWLSKVIKLYENHIWSSHNIRPGYSYIVKINKNEHIPKKVFSDAKNYVLEIQDTQDEISELCDQKGYKFRAGIVNDRNKDVAFKIAKTIQSFAEIKSL